MIYICASVFFPFSFSSYILWAFMAGWKGQERWEFGVTAVCAFIGVFISGQCLDILP